MLLRAKDTHTADELFIVFMVVANIVSHPLYSLSYFVVMFMNDLKLVLCFQHILRETNC